MKPMTLLWAIGRILEFTLLVGAAAWWIFDRKEAAIFSLIIVIILILDDIRIQLREF